MIVPKVYAQCVTLPDGTNFCGPLDPGRFPNLGAVITRAIPFIFVFAGIALLAMIIIGGFSLLSGAGDPKKIEAGKQRITYAIVGFLIVFLAYWLVQLVALIFGIDEIKGMFGL